MAAPDQVKVNVKLRQSADPAATLRAVMSKAGVLDATQVFPGESDPELARLYLLDVKADVAGSTIDDLKRDDHVEYVEPAAPRRLIR